MEGDKEKEEGKEEIGEVRKAEEKGELGEGEFVIEEIGYKNKESGKEGSIQGEPGLMEFLKKVQKAYAVDPSVPLVVGDQITTWINEINLDVKKLDENPK